MPLGHIFHNWRPLLSVCLFVWISVLPATTAHAQFEGKSFEAVFTSTPPVIDGVLDDEVWQKAAVIEDFHEVEPNEYSPPKEKLRSLRRGKPVRRRRDQHACR
jgi:hypothetical protein